MSIFVVDLGFSSAKWLNKTEKGMVSSCYRKTKGDSIESYRYGDDVYIVGEKALLETGSQYIRTVEELVEMYPLFVGVCLTKSKTTENLSTLVVGLPYEFWRLESDKARRGKLSSIRELISELESLEINSHNFTFENVYIYPQGLGGIKAYIANNECKGNILGIDIGFNTIIYTLYSCEEKEILYGKTFYKKGLHEMAVNKLLPTLQKKGFGGKSFTPIEINYIVKTGYIQSGFDKIDLTPEIEDASMEYIEEMLGLIIGDLKAHGGVVTFDTVLFFGGGARLIKDRIKSEKVKIEVVPEPEFANAVGFEIKAQE